MPKRFVKAGVAAVMTLKAITSQGHADLEAKRIVIDDGLAAHTLAQDSKAISNEITGINHELANDALESKASEQEQESSDMPFGIEKEAEQNGTDPNDSSKVLDDEFEEITKIENENKKAEIENREEAVAAAEADQERAGAIVENQHQAEASQYQAGATLEDQDPGQHWASTTAEDQDPGQSQAAAAAEDREPGQHWASATAEDQDPGPSQAAATTEPDIWLEDDTDVHDPDID
jgi:hypothetical protein